MQFLWNAKLMSRKDQIRAAVEKHDKPIAKTTKAVAV